MSSLLRLLFLFSSLIFAIVNSEDSLLFAEDTLSQSHGRIIYSSVIFRHGARSPSNQYPNDPYQHESYWQVYWPQGRGQLTKAGKLGEYNLGKWFRKRYHSLVKNGYRYDLLRVHSSDADRVIMSGECFLAGFFPPLANETWADDGLKWQPVPIRAIPKEFDTMINFAVDCKRYELEKDRINRSPEMRDFYSKHQEIFKYIAANSGFEMSSNNVLQAIDNALSVWDSLFNEELNNLTLPAWTNHVYPEPLKTFGALSVGNIAYSHEMRRLRAGTLIGNMIKEMELKVQGKLTETFHIYAGHDTTISGVLKSLEIYNDIIPPYSSSLFLELRQKENDYVVTILYRNTTTSAPYLLQLPNCGYVCTLGQFKKLTENLIPKNWQEECEMHKDKQQ